MTWQGRELKSLTLNGVKTEFTYNADGLRINKTTGGVSHDYIWSGDTLLAEVTAEYTLRFLYDGSGNIIGFEHITASTTDTDITYYYEKNIFGDVIAIYDEAGNPVAAYAYNAYGQCHVLTNHTDDSIGSLNPIRYRSYYNDTDIYLYYLQSRYYDPVACRFINADGQLNGGFLGNNMFAYCENNPVNYKRSNISTGYSNTMVLTSKCASSDISTASTLNKNSHCVLLGSEESQNTPKSSGYSFFGYEIRRSLEWEKSPLFVSNYYIRIGFSSCTTKTEGKQGILYGFLGSTSDIMSPFGATPYIGYGVNLWGIIGGEYQLQALGVGQQFNIGRFVFATNSNILGCTSITIGLNTDLGDGYTRTDGFTFGINTFFCLEAVACVCAVVFALHGNSSPLSDLIITHRKA